MNEIVFVGLGLHDELGISLRGIEEVRTAENVFIELYTSLLPNFELERLEKISGKEIKTMSRKDFEEENGNLILKAANEGKTVLLVPGDPLVATTHIALRIKAKKLSVKTRIIHGASILSAAIGLSGLHNYKFGKSVTIPFSENPSNTPYEVIVLNKRHGLHTLCLLDIAAEEKRYLSICEGLELLLETERKLRKKAATLNTLAVGIARAGSDDPVVKADFAKNLLSYNFGAPPYTLIFPGTLHFMEADALVWLADGPKALREDAK